MRIYVSIFISLVLFSAGKGQTTAQDWTKNDCVGIPHHLFDDLDQGKVVILDFVHAGCLSCMIATTYLEQMWQDYQISDPGKVVLYMLSYDSTTTCNDLQSWAATNSFTQPIFFNGAHEVAYYGGMGMPTIVVAGGGQGHDLFYKKLGFNPPDDPVIRAAIDDAIVNSVSVEGIQSVIQPKVYPNPAHDQVHIEGLKTETEISLRNVTGEKIMMISACAGSLEIKTTELPAGVYFLILSDGKQSFEQMLVITH